MATLEAARSLALGLPEAVEQPYHGFPSFRVGGKIFANLPDDEHMHLMLSEEEIREAVAAFEGCEEQWWGKKLAALRIALPLLDEDDLGGLLVAAWRRRASKSLQARFDQGA